MVQLLSNPNCIQDRQCRHLLITIQTLHQGTGLAQPIMNVIHDPSQRHCVARALSTRKSGSAPPKPGTS